MSAHTQHVVVFRPARFGPYLHAIPWQTSHTLAPGIDDWRRALRGDGFGAVELMPLPRAERGVVFFPTDRADLGVLNLFSGLGMLICGTTSPK